MFIINRPLREFDYFCKFRHIFEKRDLKMEKRQEHALNDLFETLRFTGHASVPKWRLVRWFGQLNFTVVVRREVRQRWKDYLAENDLETQHYAMTMADTTEWGSDNVHFIVTRSFFRANE
jgi:hypothetical protein